MSSIVVSGDTSGTVTLSAPAVAGTTTLTLPTTTGTLATLTTPSFATTIGVGAATASASGAGITFPATQSASSDANTLDDYEEGTWTPDVRAGGSSTWTVKNGYYRKVGSLVNAYFVCDSGNSGTSGSLTLYGLPFALGSVSGAVTFGIWSANSLSVPTGGFIQNSTGASSMNIYTGGSQVSGQAGYVSGMFSYYTA
jgi:hypothetical protein